MEKIEVINGFCDILGDKFCYCTEVEVQIKTLFNLIFHYSKWQFGKWTNRQRYALFAVWGLLTTEP